jgi:hypothetical protein
MKKILCLLIAFALCMFVFVGCNTKDNNHIKSGNEGIKNPNVPSNGDDYDEDKQYWVMIVTEVDDANIVIAEIGEGGKALVTRKYKVPNWFEGTSTEIKVGDKITVVHNGEVTETDPIEFAEIYEMQYKDSDGCIASVIPD